MPDYVETLRSAFVDMWADIVEVLPKVVLAIIILLVGVIAANLLKSAVERGIRLLKVDELVERLEVKRVFARAGVKLDVAAFLGWIVKWFIIIFALVAAADVLEWNQITLFLSDVIAYIPNVIIAVIILLVGLILANFVHNVILSTVRAAEMESAGFLAGIAKWAIIIFSFMAALVQLGIAEALIQTLFTGFVAMLALAGGLAFGLGGRDHASEVISKLKNDIMSRMSDGNSGEPGQRNM